MVFGVERKAMMFAKFPSNVIAACSLPEALRNASIVHYNLATHQFKIFCNSSNSDSSAGLAYHCFVSTEYMNSLKG